MSKRDTFAPLNLVTFRCPTCRVTWKDAPSRVEDFPGDEIHPWKYFADHDCGEECEQAGFERGLIRAWRKATGPKTPEGLAATAKNLEGHPTAEESLRTRFNGMKHGLNAKTATYFPSKPDGYAFCAACDVDRNYCRAEPACVKQTRHFMLHHAAFEQRNPKHLMGIYAGFHAALMATISECLRQIIGDGVMLRTPKTYVDREGNCLVVEYLDDQGNRCIVNDVVAHPLFRPVSELITRTGIDLASLGMTMRQAPEEDAQQGKLTDDREAASVMQERQVKALEDLRGLMQRAQNNASRDPVLIEYQQQIGDQG